MLTEKGILRQFSLTIYPVDFVVAIGEVEDEVNNHYKPCDGNYLYISAPQYPSHATTYECYSKDTGKRCLMIWFGNKLWCTYENVTHESGHAALELFRYIGSKVSTEDQEPFCYLAGTFARLIAGCYDELKNYKSNKKK